MNLTSAEKDGQLHITVRLRRIDAINATIFKDRLREMIESSGMPVILDMSQVRFMDSSGLGALIAVKKASASRGGLELRHLTPDVERVFQVTGMGEIFGAISGDEKPKKYNRE